MVSLKYRKKRKPLSSQLEQMDGKILKNDLIQILTYKIFNLNVY